MQMPVPLLRFATISTPAAVASNPTVTMLVYLCWQQCCLDDFFIQMLPTRLPTMLLRHTYVTPAAASAYCNTPTTADTACLVACRTAAAAAAHMLQKPTAWLQHPAVL
jgi:hypothetical protein